MAVSASEITSEPVTDDNVTELSTSRSVLDVVAVRAAFPILDREVHGQPLAYLDSAASAQRPTMVMQAIDDCYRQYYSNIHRGVHTLSQESTEHYEQARQTVADFIGAASADEIVFVRGTTEGINLVASSWGGANLEPGDQILLSEMEHHSNIVPWQLLCQQTGAEIRVLPIDDNGDLVLEELDRLLTERTRLVALAHVSNALGTVNPVAEIIERAHQKGALVLLDGAQGVPHTRVDVAALGADFYVFSGHKVYGPSGIGALYVKREILQQMPPWQGGGGMIHTVSFEGSTWAPAPGRFEAGTPNIAGAIGLAAALDFVSALGIDNLEHWEHRLVMACRERLQAIGRVRLMGNPRLQAGVVSFVVDGIHPHDLGTILDQAGIAVRAGHHCAQPLMERLGVAATVRASFGCYNTVDEIERLARGIENGIELFGLESSAVTKAKADMESGDV
jgi:cysteine desulfurase/selenocysteine lyase